MNGAGRLAEYVRRISRRDAIRIIVVLSIAVWGSSLLNRFAYDDVAIIRDDARIHSLTHIVEIFRTNYWNNQSQALYRPFVTASFALDWAIASNHPFWFHFVNVLWNAGACVLILLVLAELFPLPAALAGAVIFVVHPVHAEAVANVVGRAELMAAVFSMAAALIWMRTPVTDRSSPRLTLAVPALFLVGVLCKESAIMLPPLLVLLDIAQARLTRATFMHWLRARMLPIAAIAVTTAIYLVIRAQVINTFTPIAVDAALEVAPRGFPRVLTALQVWPIFLRLFLFPRVLLADYGPRIVMPAFGINAHVVLGTLILGGLIVGGCIAAWRGYGRTALALLWVPVAMLPVSNLFFPIGIIVAERTLYLPLFALTVGVAALATHMLREPVSPPGPAIGSHATSRLTSFCAAYIIAAAALTGRTLVRIPDWVSTTTIFRALLTSRPDSFRAHWHLARKASDAHDPQRSMEYYAHAMHLWPYRIRLIREATEYAVRNGDLMLAREFAQNGVTKWPKVAEFHRSLAGIALDLGDTATAVVQIREGLAISPDDKVLRSMNDALGERMNAH
jgi:hypothetical protein